MTGNTTCYNIAMTYEKEIPPAVLQQFLWRRARNFNVSAAMLGDMANATDGLLFNQVCICVFLARIITS
jgi:hypothetical protein